MFSRSMKLAPQTRGVRMAITIAFFTGGCNAIANTPDAPLDPASSSDVGSSTTQGSNTGGGTVSSGVAGVAGAGGAGGDGGAGSVCEAPLTACPATASEPSGCFDTQSSPSHCGNCTDACDSGECVEGLCRPTFAFEAVNPARVRWQDGRLHWIDILSIDPAVNELRAAQPDGTAPYKYDSAVQMHELWTDPEFVYAIRTVNSGGDAARRVSRYPIRLDLGPPPVHVEDSSSNSFSAYALAVSGGVAHYLVRPSLEPNPFGSYQLYSTDFVKSPMKSDYAVLAAGLDEYNIFAASSTHLFVAPSHLSTLGTLYGPPRIIRLSLANPKAKAHEITVSHGIRRWAISDDLACYAIAESESLSDEEEKGGLACSARASETPIGADAFASSFVRFAESSPVTAIAVQGEVVVWVQAPSSANGKKLYRASKSQVSGEQGFREADVIADLRGMEVSDLAIGDGAVYLAVNGVDAAATNSAGKPGFYKASLSVVGANFAP